MKKKLIALMLLILASVVFAQRDGRMIIPPQAIVPITAFQFAEGQGLITPTAHSQTIQYSAQRLSVLPQSIVGLPTYSALTKLRPLNVPLLWWIFGAALLIIIAVPVELLKRYTNITETPLINSINQTYLYLIIGFILVILRMGTTGSFQYAMFYLGINLTALVLFDWFAKKFSWYRDFKKGLSTDHTIFGYSLPSSTRILAIATGTMVISVYLLTGSAYIAVPTYATTGTFEDVMTRIIPVLPENFLWFKILPSVILILFMNLTFFLAGLIQDEEITLITARQNYPKMFFTTLLIGIIFTSAVGGLVIWPSYHDSTYGSQAEYIAQATGRPAEEIKTEMLNSVSNFGFIGTFVTLVTGSTIPVDLTHLSNNLLAD